LPALLSGVAPPRSLLNFTRRTFARRASTKFTHHLPPFLPIHFQFLLWRLQPERVRISTFLVIRALPSLSWLIQTIVVLSHGFHCLIALSTQIAALVLELAIRGALGAWPRRAPLLFRMGSVPKSEPVFYMRTKTRRVLSSAVLPQPQDPSSDRLRSFLSALLYLEPISDSDSPLLKTTLLSLIVPLAHSIHLLGSEPPVPLLRFLDLETTRWSLFVKPR
jgi:hypothetical protein